MVTFLEDSLRMITQWNDQLLYLRDYRKSKLTPRLRSSPAGCAVAPRMETVKRKNITNPSLSVLVPWGITHTFLLVNMIAMSVCSVLVIARKHTEFAVAGLLAVVITQGLGYGLIFDLNFFLRNLSVIGGLLMVLSDSWVRKKFVPAGLPQLDEKDRKMYVQFAGRVLLIFLFIGFVFSGQWSMWRVLVSLFGFVACVMVIVGFKAKWSAIILVVLLSVFNVLVNNFWTVCSPSMLLIFFQQLT